MEIITVYKVTATSPDDHHRLNYGNYISHENAEFACNDYPADMNAQVMLVDAIKLDNGEVVEMPTKFMEFQDDRQRVLNKLTAEDRRILGV